MSTFCTLHIISESSSTLPSGFLHARSKSDVDFVDLESPEASATRKRVRAKLGLLDVQVPRYRWRLCSNDFVTSDDIYDHLTWIFNCIQPAHALFEHLGEGYTYWLSTFWGGNGTGGGPLIELRSLDILAKHRVEIGIAFYLEE
jgi:hypothetical protein